MRIFVYRWKYTKGNIADRLECSILNLLRIKYGIEHPKVSAGTGV